MWGDLGLLAVDEARAVARRHLRAVLLAALAAAFAVGAAVMVIVALHAWLQSRYSPIEASVLLAFALACAGFVLFLASTWVRRSRRERSVSSRALVAAPAALSALVGRRVNVSTVGVVGAMAIGAFMSRFLWRLGRDRP